MMFSLFFWNIIYGLLQLPYSFGISLIAFVHSFLSFYSSLKIKKHTIHTVFK
jgi:hypothetical protein